MKKQNESEVNTELRVALFGGTFNPLHVGHINAILTVQQRLNLHKVVVVPAAQNPRKQPIEGPTNEQRLEVLRRGLREYDFIEIDDQELKRGGMSYTIDTVRNYAKTVAPENLYLIIGLDQFEEFDKWKNFEEIVSLCNLAVVSRPGMTAPYSHDELPTGLRGMVAAFDRAFVALTTDRNIEFLRLKDVDVSASDVRKRLRSGRSVDRYLTIPVEEYIREQKLYGPLGPLIGDYTDFTKFCASALFEKKAIAVRGYDLRSQEAPSEFTLVASGTSTRHAASLAEAVTRAVKDEFNVYPQSIEGLSEGRWVLLDYGSLIVHIFYDFVRQEYRLEDLWKAAKVIPLLDPAASPATSGGTSLK